MTDATRGKPVPRPTGETTDFWEGCRVGELRLQRCSDCGRTQFPPRRLCSSCSSARVESFAASGRGVVRSHSVVRHPLSAAFAGEVPYVVALVELQEGPTMMAGLRRCAPDEVEIGMPVEVEFEARSNAICVPYFHPVGAAGPGAAAAPRRVSIDTRVFDVSGAEPRLLGSRCRRCGNHAFPAQADCARCSAPDMESVGLGSRGELWAWTVQSFPPKAPPYLGVADPAKFEPFGVGYVALPEIVVEARLTPSRPDELRPGMPMRLVALPLAKDADGSDIVTFAFAPARERVERLESAAEPAPSEAPTGRSR